MRRALHDRQQLIEHHATALATAALQTGADWVTHLGPRPKDEPSAAAWEQRILLIAAYRDMYDIYAQTPLGGQATTGNQQRDAAIAAAALTTRALIPESHRASAPMPDRVIRR